MNIEFQPKIRDWKIVNTDRLGIMNARGQSIHFQPLLMLIYVKNERELLTIFKMRSLKLLVRQLVSLCCFVWTAAAPAAASIGRINFTQINSLTPETHVYLVILNLRLDNTELTCLPSVKHIIIKGLSSEYLLDI